MSVSSEMQSHSNIPIQVGRTTHEEHFILSMVEPLWRGETDMPLQLKSLQSGCWFLPFMEATISGQRFRSCEHVSGTLVSPLHGGHTVDYGGQTCHFLG
jgi:hypothetical protein